MKNLILGLLGVVVLTGCKSVYTATPANQAELGAESSVVVTRPDQYVIWGTRSMNDYLEVMYEEFDVNAADLPVVRVGIRNRGGQHWWNTKGKDFTLFAQVVFYKEPLANGKPRSAPLYKTNKQAVPMLRGETSDVIFTSPVKGAGGYQIILSDK